MEDPLWLPFGSLRNNMVDKLIELKGKFPEFIINSQSWITWDGLSCIGSSDTKNGLKPICERCGLGCYSVLVANGIKGNN